MSYLIPGLYLLVAILVNAFMRASFEKNKTKSWVYKTYIIHDQDFTGVNMASAMWIIALPIFLSMYILRISITPYILNPLTKMFLYLMDDSRKATKIQNKKDNTPTTF